MPYPFDSYSVAHEPGGGYYDDEPSVPGPRCEHCGSPIGDGPYVVCEQCDGIFHAACYPLPSYHQPQPARRRRAS